MSLIIVFEQEIRRCNEIWIRFRLDAHVPFNDLK